MAWVLITENWRLYLLLYIKTIYHNQGTLFLEETAFRNTANPPLYKKRQNAAYRIRGKKEYQKIQCNKYIVLGFGIRILRYPFNSVITDRHTIWRVRSAVKSRKVVILSCAPLPIFKLATGQVYWIINSYLYMKSPSNGGQQSGTNRLAYFIVIWLSLIRF